MDKTPYEQCCECIALDIVKGMPPDPGMVRYVRRVVTGEVRA